MDVASRRAFLGFATNAVALAALGAVGARLIDVAEAMPVDPLTARSDKPTDVLRAQWGPPPHPGWGRPPPRRRRHRRWVCWWHRGRRHCGWRWV